MVQKMHQPRSKFLILEHIFLFSLVLTLLGCSSTSQPPVKYEDYDSLKNDCSLLQSNHQNASISGTLGLHESTVCSTDQGGEYCMIFLGFEDYSFLDIWMKTWGKNGMDDLKINYNSSDLVVQADDGDRLTGSDWVSTILEPFIYKTDGNEVCSFRVKTILRSKILAAENQPGEGTVSLNIPANVLWVDTGIYVNQGQHLMIFPGYGFYNLRNRDPAWDAYSDDMLGIAYKLCDINCVINGENYGMLVAKIKDGQPFLVTINTSDIIIPAGGELYLTVNDCADCYEDNFGNFDVVIDLHNVP